MSALQLKLLLAAIFVGFSFFSWVFKQIAKKRAEAEQMRRMRAAQLEALRTGRPESNFQASPSNPSAALSQPIAEQDMDDRQRKLAELRRRAAQRAGNRTEAPGLPTAQVLAPQAGAQGTGVVILPGGVAIKVNQPQGSLQNQPGLQRTARQQSRSTPLPTRTAQPQQPRQQQRPQQQKPKRPQLTAEQQEQIHRDQVLARQPVPRAPLSRNPISDTPDASETQRLNADTEAAVVTPRSGRRNPVRNLANMSVRDLRTAFVLSEVFGPPRSMS